MDHVIQDKIEVYLKKAGFFKITRKEVWAAGMPPHQKTCDLSGKIPWVGISTGVQRMEAEVCGISQVLEIKNVVMAIYDNSIKSVQKPPVVESPVPKPIAPYPAPGGESNPKKLTYGGTKSWDELNPMMQAPGSSVPGSALSAPTPIICDWDKKECKGKNCIFHGRTEPILGKLCPLIKPNAAPTKVFKCRGCGCQISEEQAKKTFNEIGRALCKICEKNGG